MKATTATSILTALCIASGRADAQLHHGGGPGMSVELENDRVTVVRIRLAPHERTAMHDLTPRVVIWLTDARLRDTSDNGETREERWRAGQAIWVPARRHAGENL